MVQDGMATEKVAETIGKALKEEGNTVDVIDVKKAPQNVDTYDLI